MRKLADLLLKRSLLFIVLIFTVSVVGVYTFLTIDQREIPETEVNLINVITAWPGADKDDIEENVTNIIETEMFSISDIEDVSSVSEDNVSVLTLSLSDGSTPDNVLNDVNNLVQSISGDLPENAAQPEVESITNAFPLLSYQIHSDSFENLEAVRGDVESLKQEIIQMNGVDSVTIKGYRESAYEIQLDWDALAEEQLNPNEIMNEIDLSLSPVVLGQDVQDDEIIRLAFEDETALDVLEEVRIGEDKVSLSDVASIESVESTPEDIVQYNGEDAVSFTVFLSSGEDVPSVSEDIEAVINSGLDSMPENVTVDNISSERENVEDIFVGLYTSLLIAVIAVIIGTSIGLSLFGSITVMLTVLISIFIGLIPVPWMGVDLNQISVKIGRAHV